MAVKTFSLQTTAGTTPFLVNPVSKSRWYCQQNRWSEMDKIRMLRVFLRGAEASSITDAVNVLDCRVASVSRVVSHFEDDLHARLFDRVGQAMKVTLTTAATRILMRSRRGGGSPRDQGSKTGADHRFSVRELASQERSFTRTVAETLDRLKLITKRLVHCVIEKAPELVFNETHGKDELDHA
ncbi:LysR family transcriptional regulator [Paraburkholderia sp. EG287A]|uniref:LysR family transcriptional regulator n=1 Tax=Paraburkholderia sp. EG287A TaxID=3237012 RepID=UPI0034D27B5D